MLDVFRFQTAFFIIQRILGKQMEDPEGAEPIRPQRYMYLDLTFYGI